MTFVANPWISAGPDLTQYLWVHQVLELLRIVIALTVAGLVWHTYREVASPWNLLLGGAFVCTGLLVLFHVLSYAGMPSFLGPNYPAKSIFFCKVERFVHAAIFLVYTYAFRGPAQKTATRETLPSYQRHLVYAAALALALGTLALAVLIPRSIMEIIAPGNGFSPLRVGFDFIPVLLLAGAYFFLRRSGRLDPRVSLRLQAGFILSLLAGICFAITRGLIDAPNILGHLYQFSAYIFYYQALVALFIQRPYEDIETACRRRAENERLRFLGEMAASAAHEIRNPLTAVRGFIQLLAATLQGQEQRTEKEYVKLILGELDRVNGIVERMLLLAKPKSLTLLAGDIRQIVEEVTATTDALIPKGIRIVVRGEADLPAVYVDVSQMKQVFLNLLINGIEAMPQGGTLSITTGLDLGGRAVFVEVADEGHGIPPEVYGRVFDPFFTTKTNGTGLGLALSRSIVQNHGGEIRLQSVPGRGTNVTVTLPVWTKSRREGIKAAQAGSGSGFGWSVGNDGRTDG